MLNWTVWLGSSKELLPSLCVGKVRYNMFQSIVFVKMLVFVSVGSHFGTSADAAAQAHSARVLAFD